MKNIPMFTGQHGMATLVFKELSFSGSAYVVVRAVWTGETAAFLEECRGFCRAVGAEKIYASWEEKSLPADHAYDVLGLYREKAGLPLPNREVELEELRPENGEEYLRIYNTCFRSVAGAASYDKQDLRRLYGQDCAFLAKMDGQYAAVTEISKEGLESVAVLPEHRGLGHDLSLTVLPMVPNPILRLKVASSNLRALNLYRRLGFVQENVRSRWYQL